VCLHPNEGYQLEVMRELCERFIFVDAGRLAHGDSLESLASVPRFREYLGSLWPGLNAALRRIAGATPSGA
jgi:hypothetical protein